MNETIDIRDDELAGLEAELGDLFDATRVEADDFALTRMAERAKDVPSQSRGLRAWLRQATRSRALMLVGSLSALALVAGLAWWVMSNANAPQGHGVPVSKAPAAMADASASPEARQPNRLAVGDLAPEGLEDDLALLDDDGLGLDALHIPDDPAEAEAMLDAYDELLGDS